VYRFKQFFGALTARSGQEDKQEAVRLLSRAQYDLFCQMAPNDQRHSVRVCTTLIDAGHDCPSLLSAALLHDVGKAAGRITLWQRTLIVLLCRWAPRLLVWLEQGERPEVVAWWRRGFVVNRQHPLLGAQWAAKAGCSPTTVALIRRHQEPVREVETDEDQLLAALQWADGVN
jgi:hypothetical protein